MYLFRNSALLQNTTGIKQVLNRGFTYGDGLFETMFYWEEKLWFADDHLARLHSGMQTLQMIPPDHLNEDTLKNRIEKLQKINRIQLNKPLRVRVQLIRQTGGLYTPTTLHSDIYLSIGGWKAPGRYVKDRVLTSEKIQLARSIFSHHKTCNSLPYVLAGLEAKHREADDLILQGPGGCVAECCASNIFWMRNHTLYTPSLESGCIDGVMRKQALAFAREQGMEVVEGLFPLADLRNADYLFSTSLAGVFSIAQWENKEYPDYLPKGFDQLHPLQAQT
jgi:4-amino-4-deoxychorismate lyase